MTELKSERRKRERTAGESEGKSGEPRLQQGWSYNGARAHRLPCSCRAGCLVSEASAERAPHISICSGVQRARCCGPHRVEGRLIQPPPPAFSCQGGPTPSLPWKMLPLTPYRTRPPPHPWLPRCTSRTEPCGRRWGGGVVPPAHSPTLTAGACGDSTLARELASLGLLRALRPHTLAAGLSFTLPPSPLQGHRKDLASTSLDTTLPQNLGYFRPPLPISRLEYKVWHCVAPDMVGRGFSPTGLPKEEMLGSGAGWRIVPHP